MSLSPAGNALVSAGESSSNLICMNSGADIDQTNPMTGGTALLAAVDVPKNVDMVKLLVHLGADINKENMKVSCIDIGMSIEQGEKNEFWTRAKGNESP